MKAQFILLQAFDCLLTLTGIKSEFHYVHSKNLFNPFSNIFPPEKQKCD